MTEEKKDERLPVDRHWLQKLLQRHHHGNNSSLTVTPLVLAPMVDQSDLPFRLLTRRYGCNLCYTPMIHAKLYATSKEYRRKFSLAHDNNNNNTPPLLAQQLSLLDRPLVAQLCGSDPDTMLHTALALAPHCDAIDINCGCPQGIARRGQYGAFLLEQPERLRTVVRHLCQHLPVPVTVKVRLCPAATRQASVQQSVALYRKLVEDGIHLLTIHGRTRHHKGPLTGAADWAAVRTVVDELGSRIPILVNGSLQNWSDIRQCLQETGADGVMCSEAILEYPALFAANGGEKRTIGRVQLAREYLELARQCPPNEGGQGSGIKCMRTHVHRMLHADLQDDLELRQRVIDVDSWQGLKDAVEWLAAKHAGAGHVVADEELSWYMRHRKLVRDETSGITTNVAQAKQDSESAVKSVELEEDAADCLLKLFEEDDAEY